MAFCISVRHVLQLERRPTANSSITSATKISQKRLFGSLVHRKNLTNFLAIIPYNTCLACFHSLIRATANTKPSPPPGALTSWRLGLAIAGPANHFPWQENKKGWGLGLGAWETNRNRFPKSPKPNPLAFAITQFNTLCRCP